jgi:hypothetical protein
MLRSVNTAIVAAFLAACPRPDDTVDSEVVEVAEWSRSRARLADASPAVRGRQPHRVITHLHSPWSHDACDGSGVVDGVVNAECLADLRRGLCEAAVDLAFLTDHPDRAAFQDYSQLWHPDSADTPILQGDSPVGTLIACDDGSQTAWLPGIEDELMPLGLTRHVAERDEARENLYNRSDPDAVYELTDAGGLVFVAHTEQRDAETVRAQRAAGLVGVEIFNAHAMFAPDIRSEFLGLEGLGWTNDIGPFTRPDATAEPDLLFLGVLELQAPSMALFDDLLQDGPLVGIAGSDAHQNVLRLELRDGERLDSYRRALTWFSNHVYSTDSSPQGIKDALAAGQSAVVFEVLGVPTGFDFYLDGDSITEMGGSAIGGDIVVTCPTLSATFPHGPDAPDIVVGILKNGTFWQGGCGTFPTDGPGVYRVQVDLTPHHLAPFLGDEPERFLRPFPWILSNAIRIQ